MEKMNTGYPIKQYKEYCDLGTFFAYIRHELFVRIWQKDSKKKIETEPNVQKSFFQERYDLFELGEIARLDHAIYAVVEGKTLSTLYHELEYFKNLLDTDFWRSWVRYTKQLLELLIEAPKVVHDYQVRDDLHYVYNEQFTRLSKRIGIKEFAGIIGWSQRKLTAFRSNGNPMPEPVDILAATPVWTLGQAENFLRIIESRKVLQVRGDWTSMKEEEFEWKLKWQEFHLECINSEVEESQRTFAINDTASSYSYGVNHNMDDCSTPEEVEKAGKFVEKRLVYCPETYYHMALQYLKHGYLLMAENYLTLAKEQYETIIPRDFEGFICDSEDEYYHTYLFLSYLLAEKGDTDKALDLLSYVQSRIDLDNNMHLNFEEDVDILENEPEKYALWYRERDTFSVLDKGDPAPLPEIPGRIIKDKQEKHDLFIKYFNKSPRANISHIVELFNGWTRFEVCETAIFSHKPKLNIDLHEFKLEDAIVKEIEEELLMVIDPRRPKRTYLLGIDIERAKGLSNEWRTKVSNKLKY
ncbi:hypothetical protein QTG56_25505 (plasmid) [Rossellomorea sp. AcN35-11]|nr:hypothetical protein [Rossellomorea aquimaris]WJV31973.1 hypothetical protein QTG56_25505 [Rossellomorea sp. AcN35-11]